LLNSINQRLALLNYLQQYQPFKIEMLNTGAVCIFISANKKQQYKCAGRFITCKRSKQRQAIIYRGSSS
jgi:hypothetical protein